MDSIDAQVALGADLTRATVVQCQMTPATVEACNEKNIDDTKPISLPASRSSVMNFEEIYNMRSAPRLNDSDDTHSSFGNNGEKTRKVKYGALVYKPVMPL